MSREEKAAGKKYPRCSAGSPQLREVAYIEPDNLILVAPKS
jgi:hypothetical protein